jgi:hypothetical protein
MPDHELTGRTILGAECEVTTCHAPASKEITIQAPHWKHPEKRKVCLQCADMMEDEAVPDEIVKEPVQPKPKKPKQRIADDSQRCQGIKANGERCRRCRRQNGLCATHMRIGAEPDNPPKTAKQLRHAAGRRRMPVLLEVCRHPGKTTSEIATATGLSTKNCGGILFQLRRMGLVVPADADAWGRAFATGLGFRAANLDNVEDKENDMGSNGKDTETKPSPHVPKVRLHLTLGNASIHIEAENQDQADKLLERATLLVRVLSDGTDVHFEVST